MPFDLVLRNGTIVTGHGIREHVAVGIAEGKIARIGTIHETAAREIDCTGLHILPGAIDMHVHFRDPGAPEKEDFTTGSHAAAAVGITTIIDMPNTVPPTTTRQLLLEKREKAAASSIINYGFYMGFTGDNFEEIRTAENIAGVKLYMAHSTGTKGVATLESIEKLLQMGIFVIVHAEDEDIIRRHQELYRDSDDPRVHGLMRPPEAAFNATRKILHLAKKYGARLHITHVSTREEIEEIAKFKNETVTCDVTPHHLFLTETALEELGNFGKVNPPLRTEAHRAALWEGVRKGVVDAVATDHAPHTKAEKQLPFIKAPAGVPGVETMLPLLLDAVHHGELNLSDVVRLTSERPAEILGISEKKGRMGEGADADIVIVDMAAKKKIGEDGYLSKCGWSPFEGREITGWPVKTIVAGNVVAEKGCIVASAHRGEEVPFGTKNI